MHNRTSLVHSGKVHLPFCLQHRLHGKNGTECHHMYVITLQVSKSCSRNLDKCVYEQADNRSTDGTHVSARMVQMHAGAGWEMIFSFLLCAL